MKTSLKILSLLAFLTGAGILLQWILVWIGAFPVEESVPGFRAYFLSFAAADMWLVLAAFLTAILALRRNPRATLFGIALGSAMVFFGLYALLYDWNTGLLLRLTTDELFGKAVTLYNLVMGMVFIILSWRLRDVLRPSAGQ